MVTPWPPASISKSRDPSGTLTIAPSSSTVPLLKPMASESLTTTNCAASAPSGTSPHRTASAQNRHTHHGKTSAAKLPRRPPPPAQDLTPPVVVSENLLASSTLAIRIPMLSAGMEGMRMMFDTPKAISDLAEAMLKNRDLAQQSRDAALVNGNKKEAQIVGGRIAQV